MTAVDKAAKAMVHGYNGQDARAFLLALSRSKIDDSVIEAAGRAYRDQLALACEELDHPRKPAPFEELSGLERKVLDRAIVAALTAALAKLAETK